MSVETLITEHLDLWTSSIKVKKTQGRGSSKKQELYGISKLRELVLELAVRGKLVDQDSNEEPASALLKKISAEKEVLVKEKKIKKPKNLNRVTENEKGFEAPKGWEWARLGSLAHAITKGTTPTSIGYAFEEFGINFLKIENLNRGKVDKKSISQFISKETNEAMSRSQLCAGDVLFSIAGTIGKTAVIADDDLPANTNQALAILRGTSTVFCPHYLRIQLDSFVAEKTRDKARGGAMPNVSLGDLTLLASPIPPLTEQYRIVAKVEELMALCDQLEQQTDASLEAHKLLVDTLLATLTDACDANELSDNWARLADHFDTLITTDYAVEQLKQTILQLAVQGKLVPQDPNDEPVSELLKRIAAEKAQLIKDKKIKKQKPLPLVSEEERPFGLPRGWGYCRLIDLIPQFQNGASSRGDAEGQDIVVLRLADIKNWRVSMEDTRSICIEKKTIDRYRLRKDDILIIRVNGSADIVGRFISCTDDYPAIYCDHFIRMRFPIACYSQGYLSLLGSAPLIRDRIAELFVSTAGQKTVNQTHINSLVVTLPPMREQVRIVARVQELMSLCDTLKDRLKDAKSTQLFLSDSVVSNILAT